MSYGTMLFYKYFLGYKLYEDLSRQMRKGARRMSRMIRHRWKSKFARFARSYGVEHLALQLDVRPSAIYQWEKWSIAEIVVHMADTEVVFGYLIGGIVGEPGTRIDGFDQDAWLAALHYDKRDMKKSFAEYRAFREANVSGPRSVCIPQIFHCSGVSDLSSATMESLSADRAHPRIAREIGTA
jgi:hypothetical protein